MKKGVSLITLIITIVVMIILAGAVILTLRSTNTIGKANESKFKQNISNYQDELNNYLSEQFLANHAFDPSSVNLYGTNVKNAIPSMSNSDTQIFSVVAGKLTLNEDADDDYKIWASQVGIDVSGEIPVSSVPATSNIPVTSAPVTSAPATSTPVVSVSPSNGVIGGLSLENIKASISADIKPGYTQVGTTDGDTPIYSSTMTRVAQTYYGKPVAYSANGINDWKIFYIDSNNIYLIASNYISYDKLPGYDSVTKTGDMTKQSTYVVYFNSTNSMKNEIDVANKMIARGYIPLTDMNTFGLDTTNASDGKYVAKSDVTLNENFKSALYLLDEAKWSAFVNTAQKAEVAYGGPTVRMIVASTNEYFGTNVQVNVESQTGYGFSGYPTIGNSTCYYLPVNTNNVYTITSYGNAYAHWVAGPSAAENIKVMYSGYDSLINGYYYNHPYYRNSPNSFFKL